MAATGILQDAITATKTALTALGLQVIDDPRNARPYCVMVELPTLDAFTKNVGDITLTKHYDADLRTTLNSLRTKVGRAYYEIKIYDTDCDLKNSQSERVYAQALLVGLSEPEGDASSGAPATFALTFAISGAPTQ